MRLMKSVSLRLLLFVLLMTVLPGCSAGPSDVSGAGAGNDIRNLDDILDSGPVKGSTLKMEVPAPDSLNPLITKSDTSAKLAGLMFEGLYALDAKSKAVPVLSQNLIWGDDRLHATVRLQKSTFSDGNPVSANDVVFSFDTIRQSGESNPYYARISGIRNLKPVDAQTVSVELEKPDYLLPERLTFPVLPRYIFQNKKTADVIPVGSGPFVISQADMKKKAVLTANERWWQSKETSEKLRTPLLAEVSITFSQGSEEPAQLFQNGSTDLAWIGQTDISKFQGRGDSTVNLYVGRQLEYCCFQTQKGVMQDKYLRNAIAMTINRQQLQTAMGGDAAFPTDFPASPQAWFVSESKTGSGAADKALEMLQKNGFGVYSGQLFRNTGGSSQPVNLEIIVNDDNPRRSRMANMLSQQLAALSIRCTVTKIKWDDYQRRLQNGQFDIALAGARMPDIPKPDWFFATGSAGNFSRYSSKNMDDALVSVNVATTDKEFADAYKKVIQIYHEEQPMTGLFFDASATVVVRQLRGTVKSHLNNIFEGVDQWYVPMR